MQTRLGGIFFGDTGGNDLIQLRRPGTGQYTVVIVTIDINRLHLIVKSEPAGHQ